MSYRPRTQLQKDFLHWITYYFSRFSDTGILKNNNPTPVYAMSGWKRFYNCNLVIIQAICEYNIDLIDDDTEYAGDIILDDLEKINELIKEIIKYLNYRDRTKYMEIRNQIEDIYTQLLYAIYGMVEDC